MSFYNWINAKEYTMNCFLLFDRWALRYILTENQDWRHENGQSYVELMAKALLPYPHVKEFCRHKCPESIPFLDKLDAIPMDGRATLPAFLPEESRTPCGCRRSCPDLRS